MSIATAISNAQAKVAAAYAALQNKGATMPSTQDLSNMPATINSIQTGGGGTSFYKSVTLTEAHTTDAKGNPVYWASFLELPLVGDSSDTSIYLVVFNGNTASQNYRTDFEVFYRQGSTIKVTDVRNNRSNVYNFYATSRSSWASAGTVINVYKIEVGQNDI